MEAIDYCPWGSKFLDGDCIIGPTAIPTLGYLKPSGFIPGFGLRV